jgi:Arc/MetJ-type ribon-helix-helix transcriptional regulator
MRERYSFSTPLGDDAYALVARGRFADESDAAVAAAIRDELGDREDGDTEIDPDDIDAESVRKARLDLHLVRESDREVDADGGGDGDEPPFAYADLKRLTAAGNSIIECAEELDAQPDAIARYAAVARTDIASTRANDRFRDAFRDLLTDADIEGSLASDAREDGLREATEDIETDVSL